MSLRFGIKLATDLDEFWDHASTKHFKMLGGAVLKTIARHRRSRMPDVLVSGTDCQRTLDRLVELDLILFDRSSAVVLPATSQLVIAPVVQWIEQWSPKPQI